MFKAVIFDMDGVLIDSEPIHKEVGKKMFEEIGAVVSDDEYNSYVGMTSMGMWEAIKSKHNLIKDFTVKELIDMEVESYIKYIVSHEEIEPIKGVVELIDELYKNDIKIAVASSAVRRSLETVVEMFNLNKYLETSVCGEDVSNGKPFPDIFLKAATELKVSPSECIVIEDSRNGVHAAKAAGMKCVGYKNLNSGNQDLSSADIVVSSYSEIDTLKLESMYECSKAFT